MVKMDDFVVLIKSHEAIRLRVYDDATGEPIKKGSTVLGNPTIGVGRNVAGPGITAEEAHRLLVNDIHRVLDEAYAVVPDFSNISDARKLVIVDMLFNLGLPRFQTFKKMLAAIDRGDWVTAAEEMLDSRWARQVGGRAKSLAEMMQWDTWGRP